MSLLDFTPGFSPAEAEAFASTRFGLQVVAIDALDSERDQNFLIDTSNGSRFILKIASSSDDERFLEAQNQVLERLQSRIDFCPQIQVSVHGKLIEPWIGPKGEKFLVRLVDYLPGQLLADIKFHSPQLLSSLGEQLGKLNNALEGFDHPAMHRKFHWDLANAQEVIDARIELIGDVQRTSEIEFFVRQFHQQCLPKLKLLSKSVIHNDANEHNILARQGVNGDDRVTGLIDFGDAVYSWTIADLAIAIAYMMLDKPDPIATAMTIVKGYHACRQLSETELDVLFGLSCMRLCVSAVTAAENSTKRADDPYLIISQAAITRTLPLLQDIPYGFAAACLRQACGYPPIRRQSEICSWLEEKRRDCCFPIARPLEDEMQVLNLGVDSPLLSQLTFPYREPELTKLISWTMNRHQAKVGIGRFLEPRLLYASDQYGAGDPEQERRTVHLGIDLFDNAGKEVFSPLEGTVYFAGTIDRPLDYGTLVILQHQTDDGDTFFTLFGHLARRTLGRVQVGQAISKGQIIGWLGNPSENGGWTPHLHFQIILDLFGLEHEFPGVGHASKLDVWAGVSPDPNLILNLPQSIFPPPIPAKAESQQRRSTLIGKGLSLSYRNPLKIVRGIGAYLFDDTARQFIDAYNNVPHVGHCHPEVVEAAQIQMSLLNTNTRYLNDLMTEFAEQLSATMPESLNVCYFLNSASEANELAIRLARNYTQAEDMIVLESAYHGHSTMLIDLSPYKHDGPGGRGAPSWVHAAPNADVFRGQYRDPALAGLQYAQSIASIIERLDSNGKRLCGFLAESCPSVGGQIIFPDRYLDQVYSLIRSAGGVCIADDVQTGYGRLGNAFYGFELQNVVPDIVVLGKPMGNGHPLAAVVTTREISDAFDNGMEFFSTFGGNTVSCAIGKKVLEIVQREGLQVHASKVGTLMLREIKKLMEKQSIIGDVRGSGFFLGIELVLDKSTLEPAAREASFVVNRMRDRGVLVGTDGPLHNVIKIRPPMAFSEEDAKQLLSALDLSLSEI